MSEFRIVTNGRLFRVQKRVKFGFVDYWQYERKIQYGFGCTSTAIIEFKSKEAAQKYIDDALMEEKSPSDRWTVVS